MRPKASPIRLCDGDGPFSYVYMAVTAVPGMLYPKEAGKTMPFHSFPDRNAVAFLTMAWDDYCVHMDRSDAIALLLLTAFHGHSRFPKLWHYWHRILFPLL